jgi:hypothetical protein
MRHAAAHYHDRRPRVFIPEAASLFEYVLRGGMMFRCWLLDKLRARDQDWGGGVSDKEIHC